MTNNNISSIIYPTTLNVCDKNGLIMVRSEAVVNPNGNIGAYWYCRNYDTSGNIKGQKGISMTMDKSGTFAYAVSDPDKFRSAIELSSLFTTKAFSQSITIAGSSNGHFNPNVALSGYTPSAIKGVTTNHANVVLQHVSIDGNAVNMYSRNLASSSITSTWTINILYVKTGFGA